MIEMPSRSITRFFIPMIDVLTLLFCIYLLMPMVSPNDGAESESVRQQREENLRRLEAELARKSKVGEDVPSALRAEIEKLRREKMQALKQRLGFRVLEIDPDNGKLYYRDGEGKRVEVRNEADANALILRDQERTGAKKMDLFYLILYPRNPKSERPYRDQRRNYDAWFANVGMAYDKPGLAPGEQPS